MDKVIQKPQLILACGLLCDGLVWERVAELLDDVAAVSVISFAGCNSISEMAGRVLNNASEGFALAGHSMGGRVALEVFRQAPARVQRLALLNTGVHPRREAEVPGRQRLVDLAFSEGMAAVAEDWLPPMMSAAGRADKALMAALKTMIVGHRPDDFKGEIQALLDRPNAEEVLPMVNVPTLLISGDEDQWSPVSQHAQMKEKIPGSKLLALEGVGHMSTVEAPQAIANAFRDWLHI